MNLGWINKNKSEDEIRSVILHEFGHALGAVHEHERPYVQIPWNKEQVYKDLGGPPNYWDRNTVDQNMFTLYTLQDTQATAFDPDSIMLYYFPASWTTNGKGTTYNTKLSTTDKAYAEFCYPTDAFDAGQYNTMEIRPWDKPQLDNDKVIYYQK
jgi:serralysin